MEALTAACLERRVHVVEFDVRFRGTIKSIDPTNKTLTLDKVEVIIGDAQMALPGLKMLDGQGISSITFLDENPAKACRRQGVEKADAGVSSGNVKPDRYCNRIPGKIVNYILIDKFQEKFGSAIQNLSESSVISLELNGNNISRFGKLCWLQVSTKETVYLFDILTLGYEAFDFGLRRILENEAILKVVHDCRFLSDCLYHQYKTSLANVFDTQIADVIVRKQEAGGKWPDKLRLLPECLSHHLGLPAAAFQTYSVASATVWTMRPSHSALLHLAARHMPELLALRTVLLDKLMVPFTIHVGHSLDIYRAQPDHVLCQVKRDSLELPQYLLSHLPEENWAKNGK
ncbi:piRNA biogenesis protein EXD1 isoform X1 [Lethenteron reissneri]|uniref:piRNA biogenesis protein EXD1 isoform X1 n=1 Tax=Lethenteron reissneri TaxID=7753 RepID=UPI002AB72789|nr:piRNA biogenesis protein EXD1 isoform X1 [Lethenteron reissneri]